MDCQFCNNSFSNKYTLRTHQLNSKKCLKLQTNQTVNSSLQCSFCEKIMSSKIRFEGHLAICKRKKEAELQMKNDEIKKLEQRLEKEAVSEDENKELSINNKNSNDIKEYNFGSHIVVPIRNDGMINATALCKAGNKKINDFYVYKILKTI
jgi:hypothetical protein